jgi:hypothetical protein
MLFSCIDPLIVLLVIVNQVTVKGALASLVRVLIIGNWERMSFRLVRVCGDAIAQELLGPSLATLDIL